MLRFTKKTDYGLMAIYYIALQQEDGIVSNKRIAEMFNIPTELLAKILQRLAKKGLITSQSGPKGGYVLARHPEAITVGEVVRAIEGPINIVGCMEASTCPQLSRCNLRRPVQKIQMNITAMLDTMTLAELVEEPTSTPELAHA